MEHLGVELHSPNRLFGGSKGGIPDILGRTYHLEVIGYGGDGITMTHPNLRTSIEAFEERIIEIDGLQISPSILTAIGLLDLTAQSVTDELRTITDAKYGDSAHKLTQVHLEGFGVVNRVR